MTGKICKECNRELLVGSFVYSEKTGEVCRECYAKKLSDGPVKEQLLNDGVRSV